MQSVTWLAVGILLSAGAVDARAATVTFDDIPPIVQLPSPPFTLSDGGLDFSAGGDGAGFVWDDTSPNSNGTNNLIYAAIPGSGFLSISLSGGGAFTLQNLQMAISWFDANPTETITVNGIPLTIDQTLTTYDLNLNNVTTVNISGFTGGYWTADNINYTTAIASAPEPSSWALLGIALAALGGTARRRR